MYRIRCYTLFNITQTGISNRSKPDEDVVDWVKRRNTQCNFDTILQVISLRSQPDVIKLPTKVTLTKEYNDFGVSYQDEDIQFWSFEFEIQHPSVFANQISDLGSLYSDCEGVPMLHDDEQHHLCPIFLNISLELRHIYFEVV